MAFSYPLQKNQSYGSWSHERTCNWRWIGQNGEDWGSENRPTDPVRMAFGTRGPQTKNLPYPIGGGKMFRPVSDWYRSGVRYAYKTGNVSSRGWGTWFNPSTGQLEDRRDRQIFSGTAFDRNGFYGSPYLPDCVTADGRINPSYDTNMRRRVLTELMLKVGGRKASYGESIAESRQTINHLAKTAKTVLSAYRNARKGNWSAFAYDLGLGPRQLSKGKSPWAERWMEYQYAWLPLIGDVYDTAMLIQDGFRKETFLMSSTRKIEDAVPPRNSFSGFEYTQPTGDGLLTYRGKVFYRVNDDSLAKLNSIGFLNPFSIAWELVPYSFVVDWFLPVGNFLEALMAPVGVTFIDGYYSVSFRGRYSTHNRPAITVGPGWWHEPSGEFEIESEFNSYNREKLYSFPTPSLYYKSPFSTQHVLSATALIRQLIR